MKPKKKTTKTERIAPISRSSDNGMDGPISQVFSSEEINEFRRLVEMCESIRQMDRITSRLEMPEFIKRVGREKCDAMFEVLKSESN